MFAIVDIETCGAKFDFRKGRIIDICILVHDGIRVIDKFSTLINPECYIGGFYTNISGITNDMVKDAPKFHEVAKEILSFTEGKIFVAHNVGFDYHFIQDEFASLGYKFKRDTLCTVKMSRKLIPGKKSYSLGNLCESLGIEIFDRHRAEGDAIATAKVLDLLLQLKTQNSAYKNKSLFQIMSTKTEAIKKYVLDKLPDSCGVYFFLNDEHHIIYIGKSVNMYTRALQHYNSDLQKSRKMLFELINVDYIETGSELISLLLESIEIKKHQPKFNTKSKAVLFTHAIYFERNEDGIYTFKLDQFSSDRAYLHAYTSYASARERMDAWIERYTLCLSYCNFSDNHPCFHYQVKKCNGICVEEESVGQYNQRAEELIQEFTFPHANFMILEKGRHTEEKSFVLVSNYRYAGYGYLDEQQTIRNIQDTAAYLESTMYYPDADAIIRTYLKHKNCKLVIFP